MNEQLQLLWKKSIFQKKMKKKKYFEQYRKYNKNVIQNEA